MVIFSHILSRISRPESGNCITLTMVAMSVLLADRGKSSNSGMGEEFWEKTMTRRTYELFKCAKVIVTTTEGMFHDLWQNQWLAIFFLFCFVFVTVVRVRSCQGGGVWNPGCRINRSHWFSCKMIQLQTNLPVHPSGHGINNTAPNVIKICLNGLRVYLLWRVRYVIHATAKEHWCLSYHEGWWSSFVEMGPNIWQQ